MAELNLQSCIQFCVTEGRVHKRFLLFGVLVYFLSTGFYSNGRNSITEGYNVRMTSKECLLFYVTHYVDRMRYFGLNGDVVMIICKDIYVGQ